jgi:hypothetical protein
MKPSPSGFVDLDVIRILCVGSNQDGTRIGVGHEDGFTVYSMLNAAQQHRRMLLATMLLDSDHTGRDNTDGAEAAGDASSGDSPQLLEDFRFPKDHGRAGLGTAGNLDDSNDSLHFEAVADEEGGMSRVGSSPPPSPARPKRASGFGVGAIALLGDTRFVAVSGGGKNPLCAVDQVQVLDRDCVLRHIQLSSPVRRVLMIGTRLIASLTTASLAIHTFTGVSLFETAASGGDVHSAAMPLAACHFSSTIAYAESDRRVQLLSYRDDPEVHRVLPSSVEAHVNPITALALSPEGSLFATSSERGTLIRVWRAADGRLVSEVRNSSTACVIRQLCFIGTSHLFCVSSDKVKVFFAQGKPPEAQPWEDSSKALAGNAQLTGYLRSLSVLSTYFASQWAMCECSIPQTFLPSCLQLPDGGRWPPAAAEEPPTQRIAAAASVTSAAASTMASVTGWVSGFWRPAPAPAAPPPPDSLSPLVPAVGSNRNTLSSVPYYAPRTLDDAVLLRWECYSAGSGPKGAASAGGTAVKDLLVVSGEGAVLRIAFDPVKGTVTPLGVLQPAPKGS